LGNSPSSFNYVFRCLKYIPGQNLYSEGASSIIDQQLIEQPYFGNKLFLAIKIRMNGKNIKILFIVEIISVIYTTFYKNIITCSELNVKYNYVLVWSKTTLQSKCHHSQEKHYLMILPMHIGWNIMIKAI